MRRTVSLGLLLIFLYQIAGYQLSFRLLQNQIRRSVKLSIKNQVPRSGLQVFMLTQKEFAALKFTKSDEFMLGKHFFDIVKTTEQGDSLTLWCVNDRDEEKLFAHLDRQIQESLGWTGASKKAARVYAQWNPVFVPSAFIYPVPPEPVTLWFFADSKPVWEGFLPEMEHPPGASCKWGTAV